ncbi:hypothetical protein NQ176_g6590 [Zarea fungicola]|uniref:Uncharacterized protein n=1 Tax=Zarea fungicola TaxID=93591 RepID=A0ACC1N3I7_9HYPO|nr:hypothetical protein NQ176_g6590 [Lecanicillium fungicola]
MSFELQGELTQEDIVQTFINMSRAELDNLAVDCSPEAVDSASLLASQAISAAFNDDRLTSRAYKQHAICHMMSNRIRTAIFAMERAKALDPIEWAEVDELILGEWKEIEAKSEDGLQQLRDQARRERTQTQATQAPEERAFDTDNGDRTGRLSVETVVTVNNTSTRRLSGETDITLNDTSTRRLSGETIVPDYEGLDWSPPPGWMEDESGSNLS